MTGGTISIRALLHWTYAAQRADGFGVVDPMERYEAGLAGGRDTLARLAIIAALGCRIDGGGISTAVHPDAVAVDAALWDAAEGQGALAGLVIRHARTDTVPDWGEGAAFAARLAPEAAPMEGRTVKADRDANRNPIREYCAVRYADTPQEVEALRAEYRLWWTLVSETAARLKRAEILADHRLDEDLPDPMPWGATEELRLRRELELFAVLDSYARS